MIYTIDTLLQTCKVNFFEQNILNELEELNGIFVIFKMNRKVKYQITYTYNINKTTIHESKMFQTSLFAFRASTAFTC